MIDISLIVVKSDNSWIIVVRWKQLQKNILVSLFYVFNQNINRNYILTISNNVNFMLSRYFQQIKKYKKIPQYSNPLDKIVELFPKFTKIV